MRQVSRSNATTRRLTMCVGPETETEEQSSKSIFPSEQTVYRAGHASECGWNHKENRGREVGRIYVARTSLEQ
jgi:hypothetical protein